MHLKIRDNFESNSQEEEDLKPVTWQHDYDISGRIYTFLGGDNDKDVFDRFQNASRYRKTFLVILKFLDEEIKKIRLELSKSAIIVNHNFIETCKHVRDPLSTILPSLYGAHSHRDKINKVAEHLKDVDLKEVATALLDADRAITNLQTQISGLEIISGEYHPQIIEHFPHDLIQNIFAPFEKSFEEKKLRFYNNINLEVASGNFVLVDYHMLNWAFYHIFSNATKYCMQNSNVKIWYEQDKQKFFIEMQSLKVDEDEAQKIFSQGIRGRYAEEHGFSGEGLGMYFAKLSLGRTGLGISFIPHNDTCIPSDDGKLYCKNEIIISFL